VHATQQQHNIDLYRRNEQHGAIHILRVCRGCLHGQHAMDLGTHQANKASQSDASTNCKVPASSYCSLAPPVLQLPAHGSDQAYLSKHETRQSHREVHTSQQRTDGLSSECQARVCIAHGAHGSQCKECMSWECVLKCLATTVVHVLNSW